MKKGIAVLLALLCMVAFAGCSGDPETQFATVNEMEGVTLELKEGESLDIGGYLISRRNNCICTDRTRVFREHRGWRQTAVSPEVKEGDLLEIYVDKNLIEVFINRGEYVISSTVYDLGNKITADIEGEIQIDTLE